MNKLEEKEVENVVGGAASVYVDSGVVCDFNWIGWSQLEKFLKLFQSKMKNSIILLFLFIYGCSSETDYFFIGKWQILQVVENNQEFELNNNWIHLMKEGKFNSYDGETNKSEVGSWEYEPETNLLSINDDTANDDSKWTVSMRNDTLIFSSSENNLYLKGVKIE